MPSFRLTCYCILLVFLSCQKKNVPGPAGPQGPAGAAGADNLQKGPLQGSVVLYDTAGKPLSDNSGAVVSLENTSPLIQATTAADGSFTITANEGLYNISVQKQGFGTMRYFRITNTGTTPASRTGALYLSQVLPSYYDVKSVSVDSSIVSNIPTLNFTVILAHPFHMPNPVFVIYISDATGVASGHNRSLWRDNWSQVNDSTLTYSTYPFKLSSTSYELGKASHLYFSVAADNSGYTTYVDELFNYVTPSAAKASPEISINNSLHNF